MLQVIIAVLVKLLRIKHINSGDEEDSLELEVTNFDLNNIVLLYILTSDFLLLISRIIIKNGTFCTTRRGQRTSNKCATKKGGEKSLDVRRRMTK